MKYNARSLLLVLLLASPSAFAQHEATPETLNPVLHNNDILRMNAQGLKPGAIIAKIVTSNCNFDVFPPVLKDLRRRGVPDTVLIAMTMVPYGPPSAVLAEKVMAEPETVTVTIPAGTIVRVEAAHAVSSADVKEGGLIDFVVSRRVIVNGVLVIDRGAVARARVIRSKRGSSWGRAGLLEFALEDVVAVDGSRLPVQLSKYVRGTNRTKAVTAAAIITGAVAFPYSPPVALFWALKKGDDAVLDSSSKLVAKIQSTQEIAGSPAEKKKTIYHSVNTLNAAVQQAKQTGLAPASQSFKPTSIRQQ